MLGVAGALPYGTPLSIGSDNDAAGNGGIFDLNGYSQTIGPLTGSAGTPSGGTANPTILLSGNLTILQTNVSTTFSGYIAGSGNLVVAGNQPYLLVLSGTTNSYTGTTTVSGGQLRIYGDTNLGTPPGSPTPGQLVITNGGSLDAYANITLSANRGITFYSGSIYASAPSSPAYTLTIPGVIAGTNGFQSGYSFNTGAGTNILSGANTYSGATTIACGRLMLGGSGALPYGTSLIVGSDTAGGAVFDLGGVNQTIGPLSSSPGIGGGNGNGTPTIVLSGNLDILETNTSTAFAGQIIDGSSIGSLTLDSTSTGALTLSGINTFTGATAVNGGELVGVTGGSCANSAVAVSSGATFGVSIANNALQWTCAGLTFNSGSTLDFNFGYSLAPSASLAPLNVNGAAAFSGTPTVTIEAGGFPAGSGTYPLMTWTSTSGTPPTTATLPPHVSGYLGVSGNTLYLYVTASTQPLR